MMSCVVPLLLLALSSALTAPAAPSYDEYTVVVPQKRAALVLDRLLIALQKALREGEEERNARGLRRDKPRTLRIANLDDSNMMAPSVEAAPELVLRQFEGPRTAPLRLATIVDDTSTLQRRGQGGGRGRVLRCYFNAVTCF